MFVSKVAGAEIRQRNDKDASEKSNPPFNNSKSTKTKSTLDKKMLFKDAVLLAPHSLFQILSHHMAPDRTSNGSNITGRQGNSNHTLKIFLVALYIANKYNKAIAVGKAVNALMKLIHGIEVDSNKVKIAPCKIKQPNLEDMRYIKGSKCPETEVGKYIYAIREGKFRDGRQYVRIQLSVAHGLTWGNWYTTLRYRWMNKGGKNLKLCNLKCVDPL